MDGGRLTQVSYDVMARPWDVVVIGGGNAALVSAMSAREMGASVLVLERADPTFRGGNSRHTRNIRCVHDETTVYNTGAYTRDELWSDLCSVGSEPSNEELAELTVRESESVPAWMEDHGALFQPPLSGTLHLGRTNTFFLGGGKALLNQYYRTLAAMEVPVLYEASVEKMHFDGNDCAGLTVVTPQGQTTLKASSFVAAAGGFEANLDLLARYWGEGARNYHIRGPHFNDGTVLEELLRGGASTAGEERGFHSVAVDARSPKFDGGIATRLDSIPFGVVLNRDAQRFYDEGEDIWPKRYAIWGRNIALQPDQIAYCIWDSKVQGLFLPPMYGTYRGDTVEDLASAMGLDARHAAATVQEFNRAVPADAPTRFDPAGLDGVATTGISPAKTNWAQRLDSPPYFGVPARPGVTFTYRGVAVDRNARVLHEGDSSFANVWAAGEIMSGNILSSGYMAGFGMTIGTVWGRIAGREAARHAPG